MKIVNACKLLWNENIDRIEHHIKPNYVSLLILYKIYICMYALLITFNI